MSDIKMSDVFDLPIFNQPDVYKYGEYRNVVSDNFTNELFSHDYFLLKGEADAICEAVNNYDAMQARIVELEKAILEVLDDHGDLADGDVCTLIKLKRVMGL